MSSSHPASPRLYDLLSTLWSSPVFETGFVRPLTGETSRVIDAIYHTCRASLDHAVQLAWPELDAAARQALLDQLVPKSVAFCSALVAGEVDDVPRLSATAVAIALVYLADQTMDRGDEAMTQAIEHIAGLGRQQELYAPPPPKVTRYIALLGVIVEQVVAMARPEDRYELLSCLITDTLVREARVARLNTQYLREDGDRFWQQHAAEVAELVVLNGGFVAVAGMVYSVYRWRDPELPPLAEVLPGPPPIAAALLAGSAACRIYDDVGDRTIDAGTTRWGTFALNPCNQRDPRFLQALLDAAGVREAGARRALLAAFANEAYDEVLDQVTAFVRRQYAAIPPRLAERYGCFLAISRRVVDAGRVNTIGDDRLVEARDVRMVGA